MFEKVNPQHPDKVADRIAGAIVDLAYTRAEGGWLKSNPRIAVEVLIGHGHATVIIETSLTRADLSDKDVLAIVGRICPNISELNQLIIIAEQDPFLSQNQQNGVRVGDNGIFRGLPMSAEQKNLAGIAKVIYDNYPTDGKYIISFSPEKQGQTAVICQSNIDKPQEEDIRELLLREFGVLNCNINPLGHWTGGTDVDCGATNRKLGSDMGDAVTGGGLHGKDLSKADVSVNIVCHILAKRSDQEVEACTAIGDTDVVFRYANGNVETMPYAEVVEQARMYIFTHYGSFEKFAEWGLIS